MSWTDWAQHTYQWQQTANSQELWLCARLLVPLSLIAAIPTTERHKLRTEVGLFQFRMIQSVQTLRRKYANPTPHQPPSPLWLTKYVAQALPPRETPQNLRNHVGAPMRSGTKRKHRTEVATAEPIDPDQWIRDARGANDDEAWHGSQEYEQLTQHKTNPPRSVSVSALTHRDGNSTERQQAGWHKNTHSNHTTYTTGHTPLRWHGNTYAPCTRTTPTH